MADKKISALPAATTPLAGTEVLPIVQGGSTVKVAVSDLTAGRTVNTATVVAGTDPSGFGVLRVGGQGFFGGDILFGDNTYDIGAPANFRPRNIYLSQNIIQTNAGYGFRFSANTPAPGMTSQQLTWYEEGAFTPVITSSSGTITAYTATGYYTRVGDAITVHVQITVTDPGSASGTLNFAGLPFTSKNVGIYAAVAQAREDNVTGSYFQVLITNNNTTGTIPGANWSSNVLYVFCTTYLVA